MPELVVHHLPGAWGIPSVSPFCLKLDAYLRITDIPHRAVMAPTPFPGPKRKAPWIDHDGKSIGDSNFIIDYLQTKFGVDPDRELNAGQRATALAFKRMIEENLYWTMVYDRWMVDANFAVFRKAIFAGLPAPLRAIVPAMARRNVGKQLRGHGIGVHTRDEIHAIGRRDIAALSDFLGGNSYFMGAKATSIDASAYGQLINIMNAPIETPVKDEALGRKNLVAYVERFRAKFYPG